MQEGSDGFAAPQAGAKIWLPALPFELSQTSGVAKATSDGLQPTSVRSLLVAMPGAPGSFLLLVVRPGAPSSVLAPNSDGLQPTSMVFNRRARP